MLSKKNRLSRKDFPAPSLRGIRLKSPLFSLVVYKNLSPVSLLKMAQNPSLPSKTEEHSRIAVVVSKKIAKTAVRRNNIRRRMYDALGVFVTRFARPVTIVAYPTALVIEASFQDIEKELKKVLDDVKVFS